MQSFSSKKESGWQLTCRTGDLGRRSIYLWVGEEHPSIVIFCSEKRETCWTEKDFQARFQAQNSVSTFFLSTAFQKLVPSFYQKQLSMGRFLNEVFFFSFQGIWAAFGLRGGFLQFDFFLGLCPKPKCSPGRIWNLQNWLLFMFPSKNNPRGSFKCHLTYSSLEFFLVINPNVSPIFLAWYWMKAPSTYSRFHTLNTGVSSSKILPSEPQKKHSTHSLTKPPVCATLPFSCLCLVLIFFFSFFAAPIWC